MWCKGYSEFGMGGRQAVAAGFQNWRWQATLDRPLWSSSGFLFGTETARGAVGLGIASACHERSPVCLFGGVSPRRWQSGASTPRTRRLRALR